MSRKSHRWELNPRPLGSCKPSNSPLRPALTLVRGGESGDSAPNPGRNPEMNDSHTTTGPAIVRPLGAVSRAVANGWRYGHLDLVPPDGPVPPRAA
jgi:hypothetical protein